jgi:hypothetical protein
VELAEQRSRRGGQERRYRYRVPPHTGDHTSADTEGHGLFVEAVIEELRRRAGQRAADTPVLAVDAELWVDPDDWAEARTAIREAATLLHERARRPHEPSTVHVNTSLVMFVMADPAPAAVDSP